MQPDEIGELVVKAVEADQFLILPDPTASELIRRRAQDVNVFLAERFASLPLPQGEGGQTR